MVMIFISTSHFFFDWPLNVLFVYFAEHLCLQLLSNWFQMAVLQEVACSRAQLNIPMQTLVVDTTTNQNGLSLIVITRDPLIWMNWVGGVSLVGLGDYMTHYKMFFLVFMISQEMSLCGHSLLFKFCDWLFISSALPCLCQMGNAMLR